MADKRHIIHPHIERVNGNTQSEINQQLKNFFLNVSQDDILYDNQEELNKGILVINNDVEDPSIYIKDSEGNIVKISSNGTKDVETYEDAILDATSKNIGRIFYVKSESIYEGITYSIGPYIVIGEGEMMKLAASSPSGDVEGDVAMLKNKTNNLQKDVSKITGDITNLEQSLISKVDVVENSRLMTNVEGDKLAGIAEGAQVNVIEKIEVNGKEMPITNKTLALTIDVDFPEVDGRLINAYLDGKDLVLELENADDISVDLSELFFEQYTPSSGISIENSIIGLKLGSNEKILAFDSNGGLILNKDFDTIISNLEDELSNIIVSVSTNTQSINDINDKFNEYATLEFVSTLGDSINEINNTISAVSETINTHSESIEEITNNVGAHTEAISEITNSINDIEDDIVSISGDVETIISDLSKVQIISATDYVIALEYATNNNIGQIVHLTVDSEVNEQIYLKGYYIVEGEGILSFIMTSDGTQDEIENLNNSIELLSEKDSEIDAYTVNGQLISQEGGVVLDGEDVSMGEVIQETTYLLSMVNSGDTVNSAIKKLENSLAATVIAMTASLNDLNFHLTKILEEKYVLKSEYDALVERIEALENTEKGE